MTIQIRGIIATAMWFALGLISYLLIGDYSVFVWSDPWVYIYMAFWPVIWIWFFLLWVAAIIIVGGIIFLVCTWWNERHLRKIHKSATEIRRVKKP